jgi:2-phospho-L-lactate/phosphoenolpyruvate guanylyltransferase
VPPTVVVLPVKRPAFAKSRLATLGDDVRRELAAAFARDALAAALGAAGVDEVVVVTDDPTLTEHARGAGCRVLSDPGELNAALRAAADTLPPETFVVALCADLPALTAPDLEAALAAMRGEAAFVADRQGTGTTVYAAPRAEFAPAFGAGSAARHRAAGAAEVPGELVTLRLDVDDEPSLAAAEQVGLGAHTRAALDAARSRDGRTP